MRDFFVRFIILANLRTYANFLATRDTDEEGKDDRLARILITAADEIESYLDEKSKGMA